MPVSLINGLADLSKELGETSANQTPNRVKHYNDAVQEFFNERRWPFSTKIDSSLITTAGEQRYDLSGITDMRKPGGIKEVTIGEEASDNLPYLPVPFSSRYMPQYRGRKFFYIDDESNEIVFLGTISETGLYVNIRYYFVPARAEVVSSGSFPFPDQFRKTVATLAAANVQWGRYLDSQGNRLYNMYQRLLNKVDFQQAERSAGNPRRIGHPLGWLGFRRR